jgi:sulfonate transport system substrate-binding protein
MSDKMIFSQSPWWNFANRHKLSHYVDLLIYSPFLYSELCSPQRHLKAGVSEFDLSRKRGRALNRRRLLQASILATPALLKFGRAFASDRVVRVGYQKSSASLVLLKAQGLLAKRLAPLGYNVTWSVFTSGPPVLEALNAGAVNFAFTGEPPPIFAQAAGVPVVYTAATQPSPKSVAILVGGDSKIGDIADLRGKKIAVAKGSSAHFLLVAALQHAGIRYSEVQPIYLQPPDGRVALQSGAVQAWSIWDPFYAAATLAGARLLRDGTGLMPNRAFYLSSRDFAAGNAQALQASISALKEIEAWEPAHLSEISSDISTTTGVPAAVLETWFKRQKYGVGEITSGIISDQQRIADTFFELGLIPTKIDVSRAVVNGRNL